MGQPDIYAGPMIMGGEGDVSTIATLVARDRPTKVAMATMVHTQALDEWLARRLMAWVRELCLEISGMAADGCNEPARVRMVETWTV